MEMFEIAYTMHRGKLCRQQQDCILIDGAIHQDSEVDPIIQTIFSRI